MSISIAMCTYNGASYLQQQLNSIEAQVRPPDEVIVCDDGSTDSTLTLLESFASTASFPVRIVRNKTNLGYSRNFAQAVELCSKDIIALSDQDDIWYSHKLQRLEQRFNLDPDVDGVFSDGDLIDSRSQPTGRRLWDSFSFDRKDQANLNSGLAVDVLLQRNVVTGMAFAFRSRIKSMLGSVPGSWIHDGWLAFLIAARSKLIAEPEILVGYRVHVSQQIGAPASLPEKLRLIREKGVGSYLTRLRERNLDEYQRTAIQFEELAGFLRREPRQGEAALIARIDEKAAYARRGALALSSSRLSRWLLLAPHLETYGEFSPNALRTLSRDLIV